ncbi:hypothetical protein K7A41_00805 [Sphingobacterium sp. InxBP1]|uniref:hypothetical protein n=1 Tax=Sphingobacterium sp. InxBP1 TaxID=2870328 RepID=UPI00224452E9|nr:hypothetical protein [Sphingobacterium sp. InxBP1]MCW8309758.1 hypothetical protein [Sphingobacterium sp. InxBP1]
MHDCFSNLLRRDRKQGPKARQAARSRAQFYRKAEPDSRGQSSQLPGKMDGRLRRGRKIRPGANDMNGKTSADK